MPTCCLAQVNGEALWVNIGCLHTEGRSWLSLLSDDKKGSFLVNLCRESPIAGAISSDLRCQCSGNERSVADRQYAGVNTIWPIQPRV